MNTVVCLLDKRGYRILLVIAVCIPVFVGYQVNKISHRRTAIEDLKANGCLVLAAGVNCEKFLSLVHQPGNVKIPVWRQWLGDEAIGVIMLPEDASDDEVAALSAEFPEAQFCAPAYRNQPFGMSISSLRRPRN